MQTIQSLANLSFDALFIAFDEAFGNYEVQINRAELEVMLSRRGFDQKLSFGAFDGDQLVSFTCNGIGEFNGITTACDTGTLSGYQGQKPGFSADRRSGEREPPSEYQADQC